MDKHQPDAWTAPDSEEEESDWPERPPVEPLEYSDDLAFEDIEGEGALGDFLKARLGELVEAQQVGTEARFAAERLRAVALDDCRHLSDLLVVWEDAINTGRAGEPGWVQAVRHDLGSWWNRLVATANHFAHHPDHQLRWRPLLYCNAQNAEDAKMSGLDAVLRSRLQEGS